MMGQLGGRAYGKGRGVICLKGRARYAVVYSLTWSHPRANEGSANDSLVCGSWFRGTQDLIGELKGGWFTERRIF